MRVLVQRVSRASVGVAGEVIGEIKEGLVLLVGVCADDGPQLVDKMANKIANLRIFNDEQGRFNRNLRDIHGELLIVSQFTLYANVKKGRRPSFTQAARPELAEPLIEALIQAFRRLGVPQVASGRFGAVMDVDIHNQGPVTLMVDSDEVCPSQAG